MIETLDLSYDHRYCRSEGFGRDAEDTLKIDRYTSYYHSKRETESPYVDVYMRLKDLIASGVMVQKFDEVHAYLTFHRSLLPLLSEMSEDAKGTFGKSQQILRFSDPDDPYLVFVIRSYNYNKKFPSAVKKFANTWYEKITKTDGCVIIMSDFQQPK